MDWTDSSEMNQSIIQSLFHLDKSSRGVALISFAVMPREQYTQTINTIHRQHEQTA